MLDSVSNRVYENFSNILKMTEYSGTFGGKEVTEDNAVVVRGDVTMQENYNFSSTVSSYPVQSGIDISDHVRPNNHYINATCVVSDASLSYFDTFSSLSNSTVGQFLRDGINAIGPYFEDEDDPFEFYLSRAQEVFKQLHDWWERGQPLRLDTAFDVDGVKNSPNGFDGSTDTAFVIESLNIPRTPEIGSNALKFVVTFKKIRFAYLGTTNRDFYIYDFDKGEQNANNTSNAIKEAEDPKAVDAATSLRDAGKDNPDRQAIENLLFIGG